MNITDTINQLKSIKLEPTEECRDHVYSLMQQLMPIRWLSHPLKAGSIISRCRKNPPNLDAESFGCKKPEQVNDLQRASICRESVFYAAGCDKGKCEYADMIALIETSKLHREGHEKGREKIAVSHWLVKQDINMTLVCHPKVQVETRLGEPVNDMQRHYMSMLPSYPDQSNVDEFDKLVEFIAKEFARKVPEGQNHLYTISAYFAHCILTPSNGIIYPSAQTEGHLGFNVALHPETKEKSLQFIDAKECVLYKAKNYMPVPAEKYTDEQINSYLETDVNSLPWID